MSGLVDKVRAGARSWGLLAGALVLGLLAFGMSAWYLQRRQVAIENELMGQQGERRQVVVALTELKPGVVISSQNMAVGEVPVKHLSGSAVTPEEFKMYDGKVLTSAMAEGEILLNHFVSGIGAERFSDLLTEGERAVTIQVDEVKSNENMLIFGDRVDLLLLTEQADENDSMKKNKVLNPLVENVRVLAVGRHALATRDADLTGTQTLDGLAYSTLTVGVTVDDASRLLLGRDLGSIVVMMRNRADTKALDGRLLDRAGLFAGGASGRRGGFEFFSGSQMESGTLRSQIRPYVRPRASAPAPESGAPPVSGETVGPPATAPTAAVTPHATPTGAP